MPPPEPPPPLGGGLLIVVFVVVLVEISPSLMLISPPHPASITELKIVQDTAAFLSFILLLRFTIDLWLYCSS